MAGVSKIHHKMAAIVRWNARIVAFMRRLSETSYEVDGSVRDWHREQRVRELVIKCKNCKFLQELKLHLEGLQAVQKYQDSLTYKLDVKEKGLHTLTIRISKN